MMNVYALFAPIQAAKTSGVIEVTFNAPVSVIAHSVTGLVAAEDIAIEILLADGVTWQELFDTALVLTEESNSVQLIGIGNYRVVKGITTNTVGVDIWR